VLNFIRPIFIKVTQDTPNSPKYREAIFTARINDYIALSPQYLGEYPASREERSKLEEILNGFEITVTGGRWTSMPNPLLSGEL
jgi:hypothetical protein